MTDGCRKRDCRAVEVGIFCIFQYPVRGAYILTPDTLGFNTVYYFDMDGNFRVWQYLHRGKGIYWFELAENENDEDGLLLYTQQDEFIRSVDFYISGDTLILDETLSKGPKRYFLRTGEL
jgi:hypothetical protein